MNTPIETKHCPFNFKTIKDCVNANKFKVCTCEQVANYYKQNKNK